MTSVDVSAFNAWSLLSLTATAHGAPTYPDELGVSYVWDTTVPNGRYISPGDLAVIRDNRIVFGAGWIDSIETAPGRKVRYRCPNARARTSSTGRASSSSIGAPTARPSSTCQPRKTSAFRCSPPTTPARGGRRTGPSR
jgi:hypothetical protein